jgi:hypothetical protein
MPDAQRTCKNVEIVEFADLAAWLLLNMCGRNMSLLKCV